jgi:hypothetical protein
MPHIRLLEAKFGHEAVVDALRSETAVMRDRIARGDVPEDVAEAIAGAVPERLRLGAVPSLQRVINATGVIVHTNLGRAPLSRGASTTSHAAREDAATSTPNVSSAGSRAPGPRLSSTTTLRPRSSLLRRWPPAARSSSRAGSWSRSAAGSGCPM